MVESFMYVALGFLTGSVIVLVAVPLVHERAVRLTRRRMWDELPLVVAEIRADRDQLRAEFVMSVYRLERNVELLRNRTATLTADLGTRSATNNRLRMEIGETSAGISLLQGQMPALLGRLRAAEQKLAVGARWSMRMRALLGRRRAAKQKLPLGARSVRRQGLPQNQPVERMLVRTAPGSN